MRPLGCWKSRTHETPVTLNLNLKLTDPQNLSTQTPKRRVHCWPCLFLIVQSGQIRDQEKFALEQIPERLVVNLVVELHFWSLDECAEVAGAAVGSGLLQIGEAALHI